MKWRQLIKAHMQGKFSRLLLQYSWVVFFLLISLLIFLNASQKKERKITELASQAKRLRKAKIEGLKEQEDLLLKIRSQSDPDWIQMVLMENLGLVPEGQVKVYFKSEP